MMEGKKTQPRAILVFGAPASGKTTFCENFAKQFKAPFYNLTQIGEKYNFDRATLLIILKLIAQSGQNLILEGQLDTEAERAEIKQVLTDCGYNPSLIWIQTDINTIKSRLRQRLKSATEAKKFYETKIAEMEAPNEEVENPIVLSGKHTFETQLSHVLSQLV